MSSSRRRKKGGGSDDPPHMDERWAVSYLDMVTVLMCLFIVLFSMSTVDQKKYEVLANSLATGFGKVDTGKVEDIVILAEEKPKTEMEIAQKEFEDLSDIKKEITQALKAEGMLEDVEMEIGEVGLTIRLVSAETFFKPNQSGLTPRAKKLLDTSAKVLEKSPYELRVEGHADYRSGTGSYATNWELSSDRSVKVLRQLVEGGGIDPADISSVGYGSSRPAVKGKDAKALSKNRRTDIIIVSNQSDAVRDLMKDMVKP